MRLTVGNSDNRNGFDPTVPAVRSAIRIVEYVSLEGSSRGAVVAEALGLNRSTCHGILKTLVNGGFLDFDDATKEYRLGPVLVALGARAWEEADYVRIVRPCLLKWVANRRPTIFLARLLPTGEFIVLDKADSPGVLKVTVGVGERFPPTAPAMSKAYLAFLPETDARLALEAFSHERFTSETITDVDAFLAELADVRARGWSVSRAEYYRATNAVAAPVFDPHRHVAFVLCSLAADGVLPLDELPEHGDALRALADEIGEALFLGRGLAETLAQR